MMKSFWLKVAALALLAGAWMPSADAADLLVGGGWDFTVKSSRLNSNDDLVFWVGKYRLNDGENPEDHFGDAVALDARYKIVSVGGNITKCGVSFSTNGIVRVKSLCGAVFTGLETNDCIYVVEMISTDPAYANLISSVGRDPARGDDLRGGYDGDLHGGNYWYARNVAGDPGTGQNKGYVTCFVSAGVKADACSQCRIGDTPFKTLEAALAAANAGDTIYLTRDVDLTNNVTVAKDVTITTEDGGQVAVRRLGNYSLDIAANVVLTNVTVNGLGFAATKPMLNVAAGATLTLASDVTVNSCVNTSGNGGAIGSSGTVVIDGGRIITSSASGFGGAIYAAGGTVDARGGEITSCSAAQGGGAVYLASGATLTLAGAFGAAGNTAGEALNNVQPTGPAQIEVSPAFAGSVGVTYPAASDTARDGVQFGHVSDGGAVANRFQSDVNPSIFSAAVGADGRLEWKESGKTTGLVELVPTALDSISYEGAEAKVLDNGDVVLIFADPAAAGSFTVSSNTYARLLCVGGGAAGGTVGIGVTKGAGGGGGAGGFYELSTTLKPGTYEVAVGAGAQRVDSYTQSWVGNNGDVSWIKASGADAGLYLMSAKGGGGGGAPKENGAGSAGGSGGGGSWFGNQALAAGTATDGYGWKGATPTEESVGGGGGGAAEASADGMGQATGEGGEGRASDITGETVTYAAGGRGGRRDAIFVPQDGATPGSGGDGASVPGKGGAGADGIVVVRLEKAFTPVKVPYPSFAVGVTWENNKTVSPFDDLVAATNRSYIADIEGTLEVDCSVNGSVTNGIDRYHFTVTLKDGYAWDDASADGDVLPKTFFWRVREPGIEDHATSEVSKTVSWYEGTNATISIEAHTTPEKDSKTPKVLVLGTLCDAHRLTPETIKTCLDTAAEMADVDYYFYAEVTTDGLKGGFEFYPGMEAVAERYWNEFWTEFWATKDQWEDDYERWTEHWGEIVAEDPEFSDCIIDDELEEWFWEDYEAVYDEYGDDDGWQERFVEYLEEDGFGEIYAEKWWWGETLPDYETLEDIPPLKYGTLEQGDTFDDLDALRVLMRHPQHHALYGFYTKLAELIDEERTYDYIILCFDRSHVADKFPETHPREADVAAFLKPFYAGGRVIWMVDNESPGITEGSPVFWATPWKPSQFKCVTSDEEPTFWTTYCVDLFGMGQTWYDEASVAVRKENAWNIHRALIGMFDPEAYATLDKQTFCDNIISDMRHFTPEQVAATSGKANPNQVVYDDAGSVGDMVRRVVKPASYTVKLNDKIKIGDGLELDGVSGFWTTKKDADWIQLVENDNLTITESGVEIEIKGVDKEVWIKLDLQVHDKGGFRTSIEAEYNPSTGEWEKDPNDGPVTVATVDVATSVKTTEETAGTIGGWTFYGYELTGTVESNTNGLHTGDIVVNGYSTNWVAVGANSSPQTVFRAAPGYILDRVVVDGEDVPFDIMTCEWTFPYVLADHDVKVWYKPYLVVDPPSPETGPVTNLYDNTGYGPTVTNVHFTEDIPYPWYPVYSMESNGVYTVDGGQTNVVYDEDGNVTSTNVYVRIAVEQPGWEKPVVLDNWTGVNEVTILPREITIQYENFVQTDDTQKTTDFGWHLVESSNVTNQLVEGDYLTETGSSCSEYPDKGGHTEDTITTELDNVVVHNPDGSVNGNYIVNVLPGDYYYPDQEIIAEAEGVEKVYDGKPSTIDVTATVDEMPTLAELRELYPTYLYDYHYLTSPETEGIIIKYSADGGMTYTLDRPPEHTDVGTYTDFYVVSYSYSYKHGNKHQSPDEYEEEFITYVSITNSANVIIHPRPVYVTADSAFKYYDGTPLTTNGYTVAETTATTGFVEGEGATFQMTEDSKITEKGTVENKIDSAKNQPTGDTDLDNYEIHYIDGTLEVKDRLVTVPTGYEEIYDGDSHGIDVTVSKSSDPSGTTLPPDGYTIKYSLTPGDPESWTNELDFVNVGISNKVWYVVEVEGYDPVTNFEYVTIWPREIVVTADDKSKMKGDPDPTLTWTVTNGTNAAGVEVGILPGEEDLVNAAVSNDVLHVISREGKGTPEGEQPTPLDGSGYPITVDGSDYVGNYHVTYVPGKLTIPAIFTSNIHGLLKIESPFANTIIPAPWKGYTRDGSPTNDIPVDRLVKPRNLTHGDKILQYSGGGVYKAWMLEKEPGGEGRWTPMGTAAQVPIVGGSTNEVASLYVRPDGDETQKRGYGMWLIREKPVDKDGNPIPFYLYGQWMTGVETVTIGGTNATDVAIKYEGAQYDVVHDTMLADPDCTRTSVINNHQWTGFDNADTIILNTDLKQSLYCFRRERPKRNGGGWYDGWWVWGVNGNTTEGITTPAGVGFWYERRAAGDMTLRWEGPAQYMGEGRDLDVWIVDHADAGDGKTHLAFKFVGEYAQDPITPEYIMELFESHSIRYLHTTGRTQADGKDEMDRLSLNLKDNALIVPALRNGTGVNTPEELADGWIWVTVNVPDGYTEPSKDDGTGDTNGAGDLWRIVVGRGVWDE